MTPKEKAKELGNKFYIDVMLTQAEAKQCALIAVDMIINEGEENAVNDFYSEQGYYVNNLTYKVLGYNEYWQEVKQEIEKL